MERALAWESGDPDDCRDSAVGSLGRTPGLSEFPQSPFLLRVHGSVRAESFNYNSSGHSRIRHRANTLGHFLT